MLKMSSSSSGHMVKATEYSLGVALIGLAYLLPLILPQTKARLPSIPLANISYDVRLEDTWCSAQELNSSSNMSSAACLQLKADGIKAHETLPGWTIIFIALLPAILLLSAQHYRLLPSFCLLGRDIFFGRLSPLRDGLLGLLLSGGTAALVTNIVKQAVGRPRPNNYALLALDNDYYGNQAWRSFPSGHSSSAMSYLCFVSLWFNFLLAARGGGGGDEVSVGISTNAATAATAATDARVSNKEADGETLRISPATNLCAHCLVWLPTLFAIWVALTRVQDHWHHVSDITAGLLIGGFSSYFGLLYVTSHVSGLKVREAVCTTGLFSASGLDSL